FARADDFDFMDWLKQDGLALRQPFHDADATRGAERLIRRIHRVVGAVDQRYRKIDHRETKRTVPEGIEHAFLDGRAIVSRNHSASDAVFEFETGSARQWLYLQHHVAELPVATRLFLVPSPLGDRLANGFAIADRGRPRRHRHQKAIGKPF